MNRFIAYSRKAPSAPFCISIYRDDRTYSGYGAVVWSDIRVGRIAVESYRGFNSVSPRRRIRG